MASYTRGMHWLGLGKRIQRRHAHRRSSTLNLESLEKRELLAADIVTSTDGSITIGADFVSSEVHSSGWTESITDVTVDSPLTIDSGFPRTTESLTSLSGTANSSETVSVTVGGQVANWSPGAGTWSMSNVSLNPGINRVYVRAFDGPGGTGNQVDGHYIDIWYDTGSNVNTDLRVPFGSTWEYWDQGSEPTGSWQSTDPSPAWPTGSGQLGYGDGDEATQINETVGGNQLATAYFRHKFNIAAGEAASYNRVVVDLVYDDGAAVYLNGTEIIRTENLPGTVGDGILDYNTYADIGGTEENTQRQYVLTGAQISGLLQDGENVIAVEVHQHDAGSSDLSFDLALTADQAEAFSIPMGSTWEYLDDGSDQGTSWRTTAPNPAWATGDAQLGYGDGDETTVVDRGPAGSPHVTTYFRHAFNLPAGAAEQYNQIAIDLLYDDGAAVYINGVEVARTDNLPGTLGDNAVQFDTLADFNGAGTEENTTQRFVVPPSLVEGLLQDGPNVIAVEVHQHDLGSSDMSFDLALTASQAGADGVRTVGGVLPAGTTTWTAEDGPYLIASDVTVPVGGVLVIEPGTTVYWAQSQSLNVLGQIIAEGTPDERIRFTRQPGTNDVSSGIQFDSMSDNRITYAILEWGGTGGNEGLIGLDNSRLSLDHVVLDHAERRRIRSIESTLVVRNSVFADIFGPGAPPTTDNLSEHIWGRNPPAGGEWVVENNIFGITKGHNDVIDFDAGVRPAPIPQILNNTFLGGGDDAMDFEGDVHIEGNFIQNFIKDEWNTGSGNSNGISAGVGRHYVMVRNVFQNVEQVAQVKQDSFLTFVNNTVVDVLVSAIYFQRPTGGEFGRGAYVDGNIFANTAVIFDEYVETTDIEMNNSAGNAAAAVFGTGNIIVDPLLADPANYDFNLLAGSPASGTGPNGVDMGALIPRGASISGEPPLITTETSATLAIGGPDLWGYRYRVDGGAWSSPVDVANPGTKEQVIPSIELADLGPGTHQVVVLARTSPGVWHWQSTPT
ncbi:MAG: hypothetical protein KDA60_11150, partial [Planctomycetales bacterium]|nr:hypothetical protein [Planctomycetales bacterium]